MQNNGKKKNWKDIKCLAGFGVGTICGLIFRNAEWMDALCVKWGEGVVQWICIAAVVVIGIALYAILCAMDKIIEKRRHPAQKPSPDI